MFVLAITLMALGSLGVGGAVIMEIWKKEPIYLILMKVFPWVFGVGAIILSLAITGAI